MPAWASVLDVFRLRGKTDSGTFPLYRGDGWAMMEPHDVGPTIEVMICFAHE